MNLTNPEITPTYSLFSSSKLLLGLILFTLFVLGAGIRLVDLTDEPLDFHPTRQLRSAIIARDDLWATLEANHSPFKAGHTLNANAVSCAGAITVINYLLEHDLVENARQRGQQALDGLRALMEQHPIIGDVRGLGMMFGFEFVKDRASKATFDPGLRLSMVFERAALERGLVTYPCSGTVDGVMGDMTLLAPPLVITAGQMDELLSILDGALSEVEAEFGVKQG